MTTRKKMIGEYDEVLLTSLTVGLMGFGYLASEGGVLFLTIGISILALSVIG